MKENRILRAEALKSLEGKWGNAVVIALVYFVIAGCFSGVNQFFPGASLTSLLVTPVLGYGIAVVFLKHLRSEPIETGILFTGFNNFNIYGKILGTMLLMGLFTILWMLLLIVPGLIKSYSYAMTPYILYDDPTVGANEAIEKSMAMMDGHKAKLFLLDLSFIGWLLLSILTLGIGLLWLIPYMQTARAAFYEEVRDAAATGNEAA
ncbi:MAG: hypothetical protein EZS26_001523 [Candidatus Ordinivivax streblomastigis]|uniref:DUF975 family protein n=1 Tax=Candidatus Ordinivivax streblomastigis TaxID=2540710 RepID=A0A5M8P2A1_9BACT|nr:MAG: hypothetical protein EZS26_001523 [Candidatus Ordinivivax streblomastigis]